MSALVRRLAILLIAFQAGTCAGGLDPTGELYDGPAISVTQASLTLIEGDEGVSVQVYLSERPGEPVLVAVQSEDANALTVSPTQLLFNPSTFDSPQALTLRANEDDDVQDEEVRVQLQAPRITAGRIQALIEDDDDASLVVEPTAISVIEGGSQPATVRLSHRPNSEISVVATSSMEEVATVSPPSVRFTSDNWDQLQTFTMHGVSDADTLDGVATITLSAVGADEAVVSVTVVDSDVQNLNVNPSSLVVQEDGRVGEVEVVLTQDPVGSVRVEVACDDSALVELNPTTLIFTSDNYNRAQVISVTAKSDDNVVGGAATLSLSSPPLIERRVSVAVTDDDEQAIVLDSRSLAVAEGALDSFSVRLAFRPLVSRSVTIVPSQRDVVAISPATLTFESANYDTAQAVRVTGLADVDTEDGAVTLAVTSDALPDQSVSVTVIDPDRQTVLVTPSELSLPEGSTATLSARLSHRPGAETVVSIRQSMPDAVVVAPSSLTFSPGNYNEPQTITVTAVEDANHVAENEQLLLAHPAIDDVIIPVTTVDNDTQNIHVDLSALVLGEGGSAGVLAVSLTAQPIDPVTVSVRVFGSAAVSATPASLVFSAWNYDVPQFVSVEPLEDADARGESATVELSAPGLADYTVAVTIDDNDHLAIAADRGNISVTEGEGASFSVWLTAAPIESSVVRVNSSDPAALSVAPATLTFTTSNFADPQTVAVLGEGDADVANETVEITLAAEGLDRVTMAAEVRDTDIQAIVVSPTTVTVTEGGTAEVEVHLAHDPLASTDVVVMPSQADPVIVSPERLTFYPANYLLPQTVVIAGVIDSNAEDESLYLSLTAGSVAAIDVPVTVLDATATCDAEAPAPGTGYHYPGDSCQRCHDVAVGAVPAFTFSGTLYTDLAGTAPVAGATVHVFDALGRDVSVVSTENGNFWSSDPIELPVYTKASRCPSVELMLSVVETGDCNYCHKPEARMYVP